MHEAEAAKAEFEAAEHALEKVRLEYWAVLTRFQKMREAHNEARYRRDRALERWQLLSVRQTKGRAG